MKRDLIETKCCQVGCEPIKTTPHCKKSLTYFAGWNKVWALDAGIEKPDRSMSGICPFRTAEPHGPHHNSTCGFSILSGFSFMPAKFIRVKRETSSTLFFDCGLRNRWRGFEPTKVRKKGISERGNAAIHSDARVVISLWKNCGNWIPNVTSEPKKTHTPKQSETEHIGASRKLYGLTKAVNASVKRVAPCQNNVVKVHNGSVLLFPSCPQGEAISEA